MLRALAISSVVWNHANPSANGTFGGGMTFLMMLSGFTFARFSLRGATPATVRQALLRLGWRIALPSLALVILSFVLLQSFELKELLLVSNWWTRSRIALFPLWYPEVMVQMFAMLYLFFLTPAARIALRHPLAFSLVAFGIAIAMRRLLPDYVWDTTHLQHDLPQLFLWNFALGWVVFFLITKETKTWFAAALAMACIAVGAHVGWGWGRLDFWWLVVGGAVFVLWRRFIVPKPLAAVVGLVSQAAFTIFLLHRLCFTVLEHFMPAYKARGPGMHFMVGMLVSVAVWISATAAQRAWHQLRKPEMPGRVSRLPATLSMDPQAPLPAAHVKV